MTRECESPGELTPSSDGSWRTVHIDIMFSFQLKYSANVHEWCGDDLNFLKIGRTRHEYL